MKKKHPEPNDIRVRKRFLLFPKTIGYETRWFEYASWEERYTMYFTIRGIRNEWSAERWLDDITT